MRFNFTQKVIPASLLFKNNSEAKFTDQVNFCTTKTK